MTCCHPKREAGSIFLGVLFFLLVAAVVGVSLRSCADREENGELIARIEALEAERDDLSYKLSDAKDQLSQVGLMRDELDRSNGELEGELARAREDLDRIRSELAVVRDERDRYLADLLRTSRLHEDALGELAGTASLGERLVALEREQAARKVRLRAAAEKARDLLRRLREARVALSRREE